MEAFRDRFITAELLSYKEVLFEEATEEWYAQRDSVEVDWVESDCIRQTEQFAHLMEEYRERFFAYALLQSPKRLSAHLESYHLHCQLDNLDNIEVDQLEVDWITLCRDYAYNKMCTTPYTISLNVKSCQHVVSRHQGFRRKSDSS